MSRNDEMSQIHPRLRVVDGEGVIRLEAGVIAGVGEVWSALVEPARLVHWLGEVKGDLEEGGTYRARYFASGWEGTGRIEVCEPRRRLRVVGREAESTGEHALEVTLEPADAGSRMVVEQWGVPPTQLDAYGAGLQIHVEDLIAHLSGGGRCDAGARWTELQPGYAELAKDLT